MFPLLMSSWTETHSVHESADLFAFLAINKDLFEDLLQYLCRQPQYSQLKQLGQLGCIPHPD